MTRAISFLRAGMTGAPPADHVTLAHGERHLRRRLLTLAGGEDVLVDLPVATAFEQGDCLVLEDGRLIEIRAADEDLMEVRATSGEALLAVAWHLGNRHLPAEIHSQSIRITRDHVIRDMLEKLGAEVTDLRAPFSPVRGAYHSHGNEQPHDH